MAINPRDISDDLDAVSAELERALGIRAATLDKGFRKAGRSLPRGVRHAGRDLAAIEPLVGHPHLSKQIDRAAVSRLKGRVMDHLSAIDPRERRKTAMLRIAGVIAFNLLVVVALVFAVLIWRGLL